MPSFKQRDSSDCGVICLHYICHYYKLQTSVARLRQISGTNKAGTTALGLVEAAELLGFYAKGVKCKMESLSKIVLPAIAHLKKHREHHYIVICSIGKNYIKILDPSIGKIEKYPLIKFTLEWSGILIIMAPGINYSPSLESKSAFARLLGMLIPQKSVLTQLFFGAVISTALGCVFKPSI